MIVQIYALPQHGHGQQQGGFGYPQQSHIGAGNQGHYPSQQHGYNDGHGSGGQFGQGHNQFGGGHGGYDGQHGGGHGGHGGGHGHSHGHRYWLFV